MRTHQRVDSAWKRNKDWRDPEPVPENVKHCVCVCGHKLAIERIPDVEGSVYDAFCMCGHRWPLPKGYKPKGDGHGENI